MLHSAQPQQLVDTLLDESKTRRLRDRIRIALLVNTMKIADAIALTELHASQPCSSPVCAARLVATLKDLERAFGHPTLRLRTDRQRTVITSALRGCNPAEVHDKRRYKTWRQEDEAAAL